MGYKRLNFRQSQRNKPNKPKPKSTHIISRVPASHLLSTNITFTYLGIWMQCSAFGSLGIECTYLQNTEFLVEVLGLRKRICFTWFFFAPAGVKISRKNVPRNHNPPSECTFQLHFAFDCFRIRNNKRIQKLFSPRMYITVMPRLHTRASHSWYKPFVWEVNLFRTSDYLVPCMSIKTVFSPNNEHALLWAL